jgi:selenoprotein W-related protein
LTDKVLNRFKQKVTGLKLIPSRGGCFEIVVNGKLVYSKLETGNFPDEMDILAQLESRV